MTRQGTTRSLPPAWALGAILVVTAVTYLPSWTHPFHFDDHHSIARNPYIRDPTNIPAFYASKRMFSGDQIYAGHYRPVLLTTYALNYALDGAAPRGYHLVNIAIHLAAVAAVYGLARAWTNGPGGPLLAAALFAWHPLNSEAVLYVSARSTLLVTFFLLCAVIAALRLWGADETPSGGPRARWTLAFWGAALAALGSKEVAIALPGLIATAMALRDGSRARWRAFLTKAALPFALGAAVYLILSGTPAYLSMVLRGEGPRPLSENLLSQAVVWGNTVGLFLAPLWLSASPHILPATSTGDPRVAAAVAGGVVALIGWLMLIRRGPRGRGVAWGLVWAAGTLLPTAVVPLGALFLEHRAYLPAAGLSLAGGLGVAWGASAMISSTAKHPAHRRTIARAVGLVCGVLVLGAAWLGTVGRVDVWRDDVSLWSDAVAKAPQGPMGHNNLALAYGRSGRWQDAVRHYEAALRLAPNDALILVNLARAYERVGADARAEDVYRRGAAFHQKDGRFLFALGDLYERRGETAAASAAYLQGLRVEPHRARAHGNLGNLYLKEGRWRQAREAYERATSADPADYGAWYNLGLVFERLGDREAARSAYARAMSLAPGERKIADALRALEAGGPR